MALGDRHPDAERLAEYADSLLSPGNRTEIDRHLATCPDCRAVVMDTMVFLKAEAEDASADAARWAWPFRARPWVTAAAALAAVAAIVLSVRLSQPEWAAGLLGPRTDRPELQNLIVALAKEPRRPVDGRLTGGFKYAPPPMVNRGAFNRDPSLEVRIAALTLEQAAVKDSSASTIEAAGIGALVLGDVDAAIDKLRRAADRQPSGSAFSDLSAAYLVRASSRGGGEDLDAALVAADRAVALEPALLEALFNHALALSRLGRIDQADAAWRHYLERETDRDWAAEAGRLARRPFAEPRP